MSVNIVSNFSEFVCLKTKSLSEHTRFFGAKIFTIADEKIKR